MRLLSASGVGNGACYADVPYAVSMVMSDVDFRLSAYYRLDIPIYPAETHCKHHKPDTDGRHSWCGKVLRFDPDHPLKCKLGGSVSRIHTAIAQLLSLFCREVGWHTRLEVVVPEFVKPKPPDNATAAERKQWKEQLAAPKDLGVHESRKWEHAIMDVVATHPFLEEELLIDVTVRHPTSVKIVKAASEPGAAAMAGEADKRARYPPLAERGSYLRPWKLGAGWVRTFFHCCKRYMRMVGGEMQRMGRRKATTCKDGFSCSVLHWPAHLPRPCLTRCTRMPHMARFCPPRRLSRLRSLRKHTFPSWAKYSSPQRIGLLQLPRLMQRLGPLLPPPTEGLARSAKIASSLPVVSELTPEELAYSPESFGLGDSGACTPPLHEDGE